MMIRFQKYNIDETGMAIPKGGIRKEALDVRALAEAQLYSPLNPYLDDKQKNICEVWYNLPTASFILSFIVFSSLSIGGIKPVFLAIYTSLVFGWFVMTTNKKILASLIPVNYFLLSNPLIWIVLIAWVLFSGNISWMSALGVLFIHFTGLLTPGHIVCNNWARAQFPSLNPRYGSAKKLFKIDFPFEKYFPQDKTQMSNDLASVRGYKVFAWISLFLLVFATVAWGQQ